MTISTGIVLVTIGVLGIVILIIVAAIVLRGNPDAGSYSSPRGQEKVQVTHKVDNPFLMPIEDVFGIRGRGTVVTGRVERGRVKIGDTVEIVGLKETRQAVVTGVEMFRKVSDAGQAGDNIGCLLRGIERKDVKRGMVLAAPGTIASLDEIPDPEIRERVEKLLGKG